MKILDVWSLHFQNFLVQIEGTEQEAENLKKQLEEIFPKKKFFIVCAERRLN